ncbi:MAG TPA: protein phosphatase 2C domain-containing protein, partial [Actinoplanes sp.]|nr:protein phosphatase 2C domain-containing protein [Actinoplanes sp.]
MTLHLRWAAVTDQGHVRSNNQDAFYAGDRLLVVADGMGGMAAGDVASRLAVDAMTSLDVAIDNEHQMDALHKALEMANGRIAETVAGDTALQGMGTTLTAVIFSGDRAALAHVGDSRAYLLRDGRLNQLTKDDTYVQMLVDQGLIRPEEAGSHPRR